MEPDKQLTDRDLVSKLLDLSSELLIKGDSDNAWTCTQAAARILAIPQTATRIQHPNPKFDIDKTVEWIFGVTPPAREDRTDG